MEFQNIDNTTALIIAHRQHINNKHRTAYYRRSEEGRNIKIIPKDQHKKRGPKTKIITNDDIIKYKPVQKVGRPRKIINLDQLKFDLVLFELQASKLYNEYKQIRTIEQVGESP